LKSCRLRRNREMEATAAVTAEAAASHKNKDPEDKFP